VESAGGDRRRRTAGRAGGAKEDEELDADGKIKRPSIKQQIGKLSIAKEDSNGRTRRETGGSAPSCCAIEQAGAAGGGESPRITDGEMRQIASSRTRPTRCSSTSQQPPAHENYTIKVNLVNNPKVPVRWDAIPLDPAAERAQVGVQERNVSRALQSQAQKLLAKKA